MINVLRNSKYLFGIRHENRIKNINKKGVVPQAN
jgi:hypothetical protein